MYFCRDCHSGFRWLLYRQRGGVAAGGARLCSGFGGRWSCGVSRVANWGKSANGGGGVVLFWKVEATCVIL